MATVTTTPHLVSASNLIGDRVVNPEGENIGHIKEIMLDPESGRIAYAVLSFGGFLGMGDKLFAIPWAALQLDRGRRRFLLDVPRERLQKAEGFDKNDWPDFGNREWHARTYRHYGYSPWWE